jgi:hypothetical protein
VTGAAFVLSWWLNTKTERKEARGETYQQEREGRSHIGARPAMGGRNLRAQGSKAASSRARNKDGATKDELYQRAKAQAIPVVQK